MLTFILIMIAAVTLGYLMLSAIEFLIGFRLLKNITYQPILDPRSLPSVSVIFTALNEEDNIRETIESLLEIDYPNFEIIIINDRSTDRTPQIIAEMKEKHPHLRTFQVDTLPGGWFGKNHGLHVGSQHAKGDYILFTDADVLVHRDILSKTISYMITNKLSHLTIFERHLRNTLGLKIIMLGSYLTYSLSFKPWRVRFPWSKKALGHGAFNLVKADVYRQCGGHTKIALQCLDDVKLGTLIKQSGFKQDTIDGCDYIHRAWYNSLPEMIHGFEKNSFAIYNYRPLPLLLDTIYALIFFIWPLIAIFLFTDSLFWLNIANIILTILLAARSAEQYRLSKIYAVFYPIGILLLLFSAWKSCFVITKNDGVIWRGTHYSLSDLKSKGEIES